MGTEDARIDNFLARSTAVFIQRYDVIGERDLVVVQERNFVLEEISATAVDATRSICHSRVRGVVRVERVTVERAICATSAYIATSIVVQWRPARELFLPIPIAARTIRGKVIAKRSRRSYFAVDLLAAIRIAKEAIVVLVLARCLRPRRFIAILLIWASACVRNTTALGNRETLETHMQIAARALAGILLLGSTVRWDIADLFQRFAFLITYAIEADRFAILRTRSRALERVEAAHAILNAYIRQIDVTLRLYVEALPKIKLGIEQAT
jgi:hypothetical protein